MATTLDANVLINAANSWSPQQAVSRAFIERAATGNEPLYLFYPVLLAYLRATTRPGLFPSPLQPAAATANIDRLARLPNVLLVAELDGFWEALAEFVVSNNVRGGLVHDAHIVVLMKQHDVSTIATFDRDFRRFDGIRVVEPGAA